MPNPTNEEPSEEPSEDVIIPCIESNPVPEIIQEPSDEIQIDDAVNPFIDSHPGRMQTYGSFGVLTRRQATLVCCFGFAFIIVYTGAQIFELMTHKISSFLLKLFKADPPASS